ncbi:MAG: hypothetical protein Q9177_003589 [Variospora cf. flavescens]
MLPTPRPLNRILSALPMDLVHFSSFPGRFIWKASRTMGNYNSCIVIRKGLVNPDYGWREDGWRDTGRGFLLRQSTKRKLRGHVVAQGASLWKPGFQLAELVAAHYHSTNWFSEAEEPAMIWEIPKGTVIPEQLRLVQQDGTDNAAYALQPREPMSRQDLNKTIRSFQMLTCGYGRGRKYNQAIRLYEWLKADNPLIVRYPEILHGFFPDKKGVSYGHRYSWETEELRRKSVWLGGPTQAYYDKMIGDSGITTAIVTYRSSGK